MVTCLFLFFNFFFFNFSAHVIFVIFACLIALNDILFLTWTDFA